MGHLLKTLNILVITLGLGAFLHAQSEFKNLRVLDKNISKDELKAVMNSFADHLDVKCTFCHVKDEYAKDDNKHKPVARQMIQLTQMIRSTGTKYFSKDFKSEEFTCYTCHNGHAEIKPYDPKLDDWP